MDEFEGWQKVMLAARQVQRMKVLNQQLYDLLGGVFIQVTKYAEKNDILMENKTAILSAFDRIHLLMDEIDSLPFPPTNLQQPKRTPDKGNGTVITDLLINYGSIRT